MDYNDLVLDVFQYKLFYLVCKNRSFSKTAHLLGVTQPSVSYNIKKLEEFLGVKLDREFNEKIASYHEIHEGKITLDDSTIPVYVIPTNEEVMIARDTYELTEK